MNQGKKLGKQTKLRIGLINPCGGSVILLYVKHFMNLKSWYPQHGIILYYNT